MADYTITQVSSKPPKEWSFKDKKTGEAIAMVTYKVLLEGVNEPEGVELNKKPGEENKPKTGDVLHGTLEDTDFGKRFKAEKKPFGGGSYQPRDDAAIQSQWAIHTAVEIICHDDKTKVDIELVEELGKVLFAMIDRVKNSKTVTKEPLPDKPGDVANNGRYDNSDFDDEPVNLEDIPF